MDQQPVPEGDLPYLGNDSLSNETVNGSAQSHAMFANEPQSVGGESLKRTQTGKVTENVVGPLVATPSIADDVDLIEKDWVNKVKEVINKTKDNPYEQARQLAIIKSDYLKKRYNKSIRQES